MIVTYLLRPWCPTLCYAACTTLTLILHGKHLAVAGESQRFRPLLPDIVVVRRSRPQEVRKAAVAGLEGLRVEARAQLLVVLGVEVNVVIGEEGGPERRVPRRLVREGGEIADGDVPPRLEHAHRVVQRGAPARDHGQRVAEGDEVDGARRRHAVEVLRAGVPADDAGEVAPTAALDALARLLAEARREVEDDDPVEGAAQAVLPEELEVAGRAAAHVHPGAPLGHGLRHREPAVQHAVPVRVVELRLGRVEGLEALLLGVAADGARKHAP
mmetsp:Transcript_23345/g.73209  ORF Transcript_23345/g.73209 Transcript_23345/m.73209 type:complete len:271 (+) Transcript_23345:2955-3767(+)